MSSLLPTQPTINLDSIASGGPIVASTPATPPPGSAVRKLIVAAARKYHLDPALALAVAQNESGFSQTAISPAGAVGVMQLMPTTARGLGVDPHNIAQNVDGGVRLLSQYVAHYKDVAKALAAYNAGSGAVDSGRAFTYPETRRYVRNVLATVNHALAAAQLFTPVASAAMALPPDPFRQFLDTTEKGQPTSPTPSSSFLPPGGVGGFIGQAISEFPKHAISLIPGAEPTAKDLPGIVDQMIWQTPAWVVADLLSGGATVPLQGIRYAAMARAVLTGLTVGAASGIYRKVNNGEPWTVIPTDMAENATGVLGAHLLGHYLIGPALKAVAQRFGLKLPQLAESYAYKGGVRSDKTGQPLDHAVGDELAAQYPFLATIPAGRKILAMSAAQKAADMSIDPAAVSLVDETVTGPLVRQVKLEKTNRITQILSNLLRVRAEVPALSKQLKSILKGESSADLLTYALTKSTDRVPPALSDQQRQAGNFLLSFMRDTWRIAGGHRDALPSSAFSTRLVQWLVPEASRFNRGAQRGAIQDAISKSANYWRQAVLKTPAMRAGSGSLLEALDGWFTAMSEAGYTPIRDPIWVAAATRDATLSAVANSKINEALHSLLDPVQFISEPDALTVPPEGWVRTAHPEFRQSFFPIPVASALNDISGLQGRSLTLEEAALQKLGAGFDNLTRTLITILPFRHALNVFARLYGAAGAKGITAGLLGGPARILEKIGLGAPVPGFIRAWGAVQNDVLNHGPWSQLAGAWGLRFNEPSLRQAAEATMEELAQHVIGEDPELRVLLSGAHIPANMQWWQRVYDTEKKWLWQKVDSTARIWTFRAKMIDLLGPKIAHEFEQGFHSIGEMRSLLENRRINPEDMSDWVKRNFGVGIPEALKRGYIAPEGLQNFTKPQRITPEEVTQYITTLFTNYLRDDAMTKTDQAIRPFTLFYTWYRGVATLTHYLFSRSTSYDMRNPTAWWARQAAVRIALWNTILWPTLTASVMASRLAPTLTFGSHTIIGTGTRPTKTKAGFEPIQMVTSTPGGMADVEEVAKLVGTAVKSPSEARRAGSFFVERLSPSTRAVLTILTQQDPITHKAIFPRNTTTWGALRNIFSLAPNYMGNFRVLTGGDPLAESALQFFGMPIYTRKTPVPTDQDIYDAIDSGDYDKVLELQERRVQLGQKPVTPGAIARHERSQFKKEMGLP